MSKGVWNRALPALIVISSIAAVWLTIYVVGQPAKRLPEYTIGEHLYWKDCTDFVEVTVIGQTDSGILVEPSNDWELIAPQYWMCTGTAYLKRIELRRDDPNIRRKQAGVERNE